ncbi:MAG: nucleoside deaminase [Alphaproteobacteria bacterium]
MPFDNIEKLINVDSPVNDTALYTLAMIPTAHLTRLIDKTFISNLHDKDFMRLAVLLALKGYQEGGCAIGGVVIDNQSRMIIGKGHNRHAQESRVYWHGETDAINDAGTRTDFSKCTLFTTLTPCSVCTALTFSQGFSRLVIGNSLDGVNEENENLLRSKGVQVDILEDEEGKALYAKYAAEKPEQDTRDWQGEAGVQRMLHAGCNHG